MKSNNITSYAMKLSCAILLGIFMFGFILVSPPHNIERFEDKLLISTLFSILYTFGLALFCLDSKVQNIELLYISAVFAALIYLRVALLGYPSNDYTSFLNVWIEQMKPLSIKEALCEKIGDYNMPYLYFLLFVAKSGTYPLIYIKWFSCIFDVVMAYFIMKCVALKTKNRTVQHLSFILSLAIPTVFINSAYWGQCDSVLAALCVMSIYFSLKSNGIGAIICYALAFSFKLQAIFILPVIVICFIVKRFKLWHIALFPSIFFLTLLPALLAGRGFINCIRIYFDQANQYPKITFNAPTVWRLFGNVGFEYFSSVAIMLAGIAAISLIYLVYKQQINLTNSSILELFYISSILIPFILPRMHERYFYIADVLSVLVFFYDRKRFYVPLITILSSMSSYFAFLLGQNVFEQKYTALALLILIILSLKKYIEGVKKPV